MSVDGSAVRRRLMKLQVPLRNDLIGQFRGNGVFVLLDVAAGVFVFF